MYLYRIETTSIAGASFDATTGWRRTPHLVANEREARVICLALVADERGDARCARAVRLDDGVAVVGARRRADLD